MTIYTYIYKLFPQEVINLIKDYDPIYKNTFDLVIKRLNRDNQFACVLYQLKQESIKPKHPKLPHYNMINCFGIDYIIDTLNGNNNWSHSIPTHCRYDLNIFGIISIIPYNNPPKIDFSFIYLKEPVHNYFSVYKSKNYGT